MMSTRFSHLIALLATLLTATAIADEEPVLNFYNWADYIGPTTIADFEAEYGIKVNYDMYDSSEIVEAKLLTGTTGYDLVLHGGQYASRLIPIGIFQELDRSKLSNYDNLDPAILNKMELFDPGNRHAVPYMWGSTGFAYNVDMILERMPNAPLSSGDMIFDPEVAQHFADCGISFLDSPTDVVPLTLVYLGYEANTTNPDEIAHAEAVLKSVRPYIKYFSNSKMLIDLPNKDICLSLSWSGEYAVARDRAAEAGIDINLAYSVPEEGSVAWFDSLYILSDAPHPDNAYLLLDFLMRPEVIAEITNNIQYAHANRAAYALTKPEILNDPAVFPTQEIVDRMQINQSLPPKQERLRTRTWARVKTGM